jgi:TolB-like protein
MRNLFEKLRDIKEVASLVEAQYMITGDMQSKKERVRINVQMIETDTSRQIWSHLYERNYCDANIFDLQDEIAKLIVGELFEFCNILERKLRESVMAVA